MRDSVTRTSIRISLERVSMIVTRNTSSFSPESRRSPLKAASTRKHRCLTFHVRHKKTHKFIRYLANPIYDLGFVFFKQKYFLQNKN